jgi:hypothetical protein
VELEVGDEVIWTFALMIYLERTVLACGAAYGILILQNPLFPFAYLYFFFSGLDSLVYRTLSGLLLYFGKISLGRLSHHVRSRLLGI